MQHRDECEAQVKGFVGARYKKFSNAAEAEAYAGINVTSSSQTQPQIPTIVTPSAATPAKRTSPYRRTEPVQNPASGFHSVTRATPSRRPKRPTPPFPTRLPEAIQNPTPISSNVTQAPSMWPERVASPPPRLPEPIQNSTLISSIVTQAPSRRSERVASPSPKLPEPIQNPAQVSPSVARATPSNKGLTRGPSPSPTRLPPSNPAAKWNQRETSPDLADESTWDIAFTDGACRGNGKVGSVAGIGVWWGRDDPRCALIIQILRY